jgi:glycosyltransferase involved in cell wall biosynthesis
MVVIDDGSMDGTVDKIRAFTDPRIKLIALEHSGIEALGKRHNQALEASNGEFVAILDGDDFWPPWKLERQVPDFEDGNVVVSSGLFQQTTEAGSPNRLMPEELPPTGALLNDPVGTGAIAMLTHRHLTFTFPVSSLIRRSALEAIGGFIQPPGLPLVDHPTFLNLALQGRWSFHMEVLGYWRRHPRSITANHFPRILDGVYRYGAEFFDRHRAVLPLDGQTRVELNNDWTLMQQVRLALAGMEMANRREYARARDFFSQLEAVSCSRKWKAMASVARACLSMGVMPRRLGTLIESRMPYRFSEEARRRIISTDVDPRSIVIRAF